VFQVGTCLGRGGFGEVYRARMRAPTGFEVDVALKVLRRDLDPSSQAVQRLRDEGRLLAHLSHPAILRAFDLAVLEERVALVTEYVDGQDLGEVVDKAPFAPRTALEVVARVAGALEAAWSTPLADGRPLSLVHRDIKPSNIRLSRHGDVKVLDFGIARTDSVDREARTATDMMVGSPPYMAPERFLEGTVRLASDVYALGASLFEALAGKRLFAEQTVTMLAALAVHQSRHDAFVAAQVAPLEAPREVKELILACLAYRADDRPTPAVLEARADALADTAAGPTLVRWARERTWPAPPHFVGELAGRTLVEGAGFTTAATAVDPRPPPPLAPATSVDAPRPARWLWLGGAVAGLGGAGVATVVIAVLLVAGVGFLALPVQPMPAPALPPAVPVPSPAPVVAPVAPPTLPVPDPAPPLPVPPHLPEPVAIAPPKPPAPAPLVEPGPAARSSIALRGAEHVLLHGSAGNFPVPGPVPPGTYALSARWRAEDTEYAALNGSLEVPDGGAPILLVCNSRFSRCNPE
jgi:serine/threonine-protein kinase